MVPILYMLFGKYLDYDIMCADSAYCKGHSRHIIVILTLFHTGDIG